MRLFYSGALVCLMAGSVVIGGALSPAYAQHIAPCSDAGADPSKMDASSMLFAKINREHDLTFVATYNPQAAAWDAKLLIQAQRQNPSESSCFVFSMTKNDGFSDILEDIQVAAELKPGSSEPSGNVFVFVTSRPYAFADPGNAPYRPYYQWKTHGILLERTEEGFEKASLMK